MKPVNGLTSWHETHYEVVDEMTRRLHKDEDCTQPISKFVEQNGRGGLYELAEELTDEFEEKFKDYEWDGEFFDEIENFCILKLDIELKEYVLTR